MPAQGHQVPVPEGILIGHAGVYDTLSRLLLSPFIKRITADVAAVTRAGAQVLEVGCGPGHLSIRLARHHDLEVTGLDLEPAMIARARANTDRAPNGEGRRPSFLVDDVAALAFPARSFDLVVSTLVDAPLGRPDRRPGRDRPRATPRQPGAHLGLPARCPASSLRISSDHATRTCPIRSTTHVALRFGW
jgi:SAM-dependent methyltransferase